MRHLMRGLTTFLSCLEEVSHLAMRDYKLNAVLDEIGRRFRSKKFGRGKVD